MTTKCDAVLGHAPLAQVALHVSDVDRAETFYRDVLGLTALFRFGDLAFFDMSGVRLLLEGGHEVQQKRDDACLYFRVEAIDAAVGRLVARGVYFERSPHLVARMPDHEVWMAFFRDPDGHLLALTEERR
ncbi:MAG: VOC family protein [Burkholderiaceae bacterium]